MDKIIFSDFEAPGMSASNLNQMQTNIENAIGDVQDNVDTLSTTVGGKQDTLTAGTNITIENNVISSTGGGSGYIGDYSISEIDTGATWIDGKKIYKKSINIGSLPNAASNVPYAHNISNFSELVDFQARWYDTLDNAWFTQSREGMVNNNFFNIVFRVGATNVFVTGSVIDWSSRTSNCIITIYYTKTTD